MRQADSLAKQSEGGIMLRVGELFAGIGGMGLGLSRVKKQDGNPAFDVAWQVELEPYCQRVLEKHWPDVRRWDDIKTFPPQGPIDEWSVDMVAGGFPCPTVSHAGRRRGDQDERWLWPEMRRVCEVIQPRWVLVENVIGLLSAGHVRGELFGGILRDLAAIGYGHIEWHSISAAQCGACHVRPRIWVLAHSAGERQPGPGEPIHASDPTPIITREAVDALHGRFARQWEIEPRVGRVAEGIPDRLQRLTALGHAVVPQVVQFIGAQIVAREEARAER